MVAYNDEDDALYYSFAATIAAVATVPLVQVIVVVCVRMQPQFIFHIS